jgi:hypothetical protein
MRNNQQLNGGTNNHEYKFERSRAEGVGAVVAGVGLMGAYVWLVMFSPISGPSLTPDAPRVGTMVSVLVTFPMLIPTIASFIHGIEILTNTKLIGSDGELKNG